MCTRVGVGIVVVPYNMAHIDDGIFFLLNLEIVRLFCFEVIGWKVFALFGFMLQLEKLVGGFFDTMWDYVVNIN